MHAFRSASLEQHDWLTGTYSTAIEETHTNTARSQTSCLHPVEVAMFALSVTFQILLRLLTRPKLSSNGYHELHVAC
jgi:hypothetical protein